MQKSISFKNANISFSDIGKGTVVVLIHGFLENSSMWNDIAPELSKKNRVITIDLLSHGKSDCIGYVHSMELFSEAIQAVLKHLKIRRIRANKIVQNNFENLVRMSFSNLFGIESRTTFSSEINLALKEALKKSIQGYMAANEGMRIKPNRNYIIADCFVDPKNQ